MNTLPEQLFPLSRLPSRPRIVPENLGQSPSLFTTRHTKRRVLPTFCPSALPWTIDALTKITMIRNEAKVDAKRRSTLNHKRQQFALPAFRSQEYPHRLNLYDVPPIEDITLEQLCADALRNDTD